MASKSLFLLLIWLSSCVSIAFSGNPSPSPPGGSNGTLLSCIQKLLPCTPYLKPSPSAPPASCCIPLKEVVANEAQCLCQVFNDADILKSFNVTQEEGVAVAKACGADASKCKTEGAPSSSPAPSPSHSHGAASSNSSGSPESAKNGANEVTPDLFRLGTLAAVSAIFLISGIVGFED